MSFQEANHSQSETILKKKKEKNPYGFNIVGIGASAGGLTALKNFFNNMPTDTGTSFVVVQHLSPNHKSLMGELLSKYTTLPITEVHKNTLVKPNNIYLIPPGKNIELKSNTLELSDKPDNRKLNLPINIFLDSLAIARKEYASAVILSGTGSDGTSGIKNIHAYNGLVIAQDPKDAEFSGMVESAMDTGLVDYVMPADKIPDVLVDFVQNPEVKFGMEHEVYKDIGRYDKVISHIQNVADLDFTTYKKPTMVRRLARRIQIKKKKSFAEYYNFLLDNKYETDSLTKDLLINVTDFFRDKVLWDKLEAEIVPELVSKIENGQTIKLWVVACSTGEEAYSYAMILDAELKKQEKKKVVVKIFATDLNQQNVEIASIGEYKSRDVNNVPLKFRYEYFDNVEEDVFKVKDFIRSTVIFSQHDVLNDPPFTKLHLASCRNLLIYLERNAQEKVMRILQYSLMIRSVLVLGKSETTGTLKDFFLEIDGSCKIYKNLTLTKTLLHHDIQLSNNNLLSGLNPRKPLYSLDFKSRNLDFNDIISREITESLDIGVAYTDSHLNIIQAVGNLKRFLVIPENGFSNSLLELLPKELKSKLNLALIQAEKTKGKIVLEVAYDKSLESKVKSFDLIISPTSKKLNGDIGKYLIVFAPTNIRPDTNVVLSNKKIIEENSSLDLLETELAEARQTLVTMQHEIELRNEELQTTNEELLATNEELQSTNEELQSVNEELHTVNAELNLKIQDLAQAKATIDNILKSTEINTLVLDRELCIDSFTPGVKDYFNITNNDLGRPLSNFSNNLDIDGKLFYIDCHKVIENGESKQQEIKTSQNTWHLMRITPFIQANQTIEGVVITFVDVSQQKHVEFQLLERELELKAHYENSPDAIIAVNSEGILTKCNPALSSILDIKESDLIGQSFEPHIDENYHETFKQDFKSVLEGKRVVQRRSALVHKSGRTIPIVADGIPILDNDGKMDYFLANLKNISEIDKTEKLLIDRNKAFEQVLESTMIGFWDTNFIENTSYLSPTYKSMFGYQEDELTNPDDWQKIIHPEDLTVVTAAFQEHFDSKGEIPYAKELRFFHKNGSIVNVWCKGKVIEWDENDQPVRMLGTHVDITPIKRLADSNKELERFAYVASHDLQEPLRTVNDFVKLFKEEYGATLEKEGVIYLDFIESAGVRMRNLVTGILEYSKIKGDIEHEKVDLNAVLGDVLQDLQIKIDDKEADVTIGKMPTIMGNAIELHSLFLNLIGNALKFVSENRPPEITVKASKSGDNYQFLVQDNGIGIKPEHHDKIFDIFSRLHNRESYEGTGIGLAHCKKIVELHGGTIWVESELNKGSSFNFTLKK